MYLLTLAVLVVAASGESFMVSTSYSDANCTTPMGQQFVYNMASIPEAEFPMKEAVGGCLPYEDYYMSIDGCDLKMYMDANCEGAVVYTEPFMDIPECTLAGDHYEQSSCSTSIPSGAVDLTCWTSFPTSMEFPPCMSSCPQPIDCSQAKEAFMTCAGTCTESDMNTMEQLMQFMFGCSCSLDSFGTNSTMLTCGDIKMAYKASNCCGNPNNPFELPEKEATRRLASGLVPRAPSRHGRATPRWSFPRNLAFIAPTLGMHGHLNVEEAYLGAIKKKLDTVKLRSDAATAKNLATKIKAIMDSYLVEGATQV